MNDYLEKSGAENSKQTVIQDQTPSGTSPSFRFVQIGAIPKTPLRRILQPQKPDQVAQRKYNIDDTATRSDKSVMPAQNPSASYTSVGPTSMNLSEVVQRQNDIAELLVLQQKHSLLSSREIPVFDGGPLSF